MGVTVAKPSQDRPARLVRASLCPRGEGPGVLSCSRAILVGWMLEAVEALLSWVGASSDASTAGPDPWDYVHASLDLRDVERGAKEGLGGTSGFSEGVRFSPGLASEL